MVIQSNGQEDRARQLSQKWMADRDAGRASITSTAQHIKRSAVDIIPVGAITRLSHALSNGYEPVGFNRSSVKGQSPNELIMVK